MCDEICEVEKIVDKKEENGKTVRNLFLLIFCGIFSIFLTSNLTSFYAIMVDAVISDFFQVFLIKWVGLGRSESTWEPEENLLDCAEALLEFDTKNANRILSEFFFKLKFRLQVN